MLRLPPQVLVKLPGGLIAPGWLGLEAMTDDRFGPGETAGFHRRTFGSRTRSDSRPRNTLVERCRARRRTDVARSSSSWRMIPKL